MHVCRLNNTCQETFRRMLVVLLRCRKLGEGRKMATQVAAPGGALSCCCTRRLAPQSRSPAKALQQISAQGQSKSRRADSHLTFGGCGQLLQQRRRPHRAAKRLVARASLASTLVPVGLFLTPGLLIVATGFVKGKGNLSDGLSRLLTEVSQGYFQPNVGGESIPVAQGELSDLAGDEPLFKNLFTW